MRYMGTNTPGISVPLPSVKCKPSPATTSLFHRLGRWARRQVQGMKKDSIVHRKSILRRLAFLIDIYHIDIVIKLYRRGIFCASNNNILIGYIIVSDNTTASDNTPFKYTLNYTNILYFARCAHAFSSSHCSRSAIACRIHA